MDGNSLLLLLIDFQGKSHLYYQNSEPSRDCKGAIFNLNDFRFGRFVQNEIEMMIDSIYGILQQSDVELRIATGEALSVSHMI